ncbi:MAG: O-methyltransferase [Candidatus Dadabacteria bacterium]|nr:MAG: O-methyltransferase [Candidatus Dadabacteria bacterium]
MKRASHSETYIVNPDIDAYLERLTPAGDEILEEMEEYAKLREFPIVGPLVGRLLFQLVFVSGAKNVLELGSGFGYSAYWFAKAVGGDGSVIFTDASAENARMAADFFDRAGMRERLDILTGDALSVLGESRGGFDIIFNDIDKEYYPLVIDSAYEKLRKGGIFITDNVLWSGKVLTNDVSPATEGVREFTRRLLEHGGFFTSIIPLRDGLSVSVKL